MSTEVAEPRWRRLPEERPNQILHAALEVFGELGLAGARLEDIAKRAGVSKGTIYLYFPNKEELFREMVRSTIGEAIVAGESMPRDGSAAEGLTTFMRSYWTFVRSPAFAVIYRVVASELHNFPDLVEFYATEIISRVHAIVTGFVVRGTERGEFRAIDPVVASRMLTSLFGTNAMWCSKRKYIPQLIDRSDEQVRDELIDFYLHALRA
ncbi:MAG TPA: TetR/AcrR family transcriptional regulator [Candidatus Elarobacter sp.]|nr:TetR/AcrR family transcriptional regulator [Candidatus Elarobacter sp.]